MDQEAIQLRVAGAQLPVTRDIRANVEAIFRAIDYAVEQNADILLTPEGSLSGYTPRFDQAAAVKALEQVRQRAAEARLGLALGTCFIEPEDDRCYNQLRFYAPNGDYLGFHSKTLTCGSMTEPSVGEINDYAVRPLQTFSLKGITVGGLICNDLWANPGCTPQPDPHLTHQLAQKGARVVFHAVNGGRDDSPLSRIHWQFHEANLLLRARASGLWIVTVDSCFPESMPCSAPGGVIAPNGEWAVKAPPQGEQFFVHTLYLTP